jgi:hypothetical protein
VIEIPESQPPTRYFAALEQTRPITLVHAQNYPQHKRSNGLDGYVYVIALSTGLVKVGKTANPRGRLGAHISNAHKMGVDVIGVWLSRRHENYSENEQSLLIRLGTAERGNEYFRRDFAEAVKIARSLHFRVLSDDERADRDARRQADLLSQPSLWRAVKAEFDRDREFKSIPVPADLQTWAIRQIFSTELPGPIPESGPGDRAEILAAAAAIARSSDIAVEDVLDWSYLEMLEHLVNMQVRIGYLTLKEAALRAGRTDLTEPGYFDNLGTEPIEREGFSYYAEPVLIIDDEADPRSVSVGLGEDHNGEAACLTVRNGHHVKSPIASVTLNEDELSDLIGHLQLTLAAMREDAGVTA